jgi:hypothetical protein
VKPILDAVLEVHDGLEGHGIPHAFGGAFALVWCTGEPRTTVDIDLNVFLPPSDHHRLAAALPDAVAVTEADAEALADLGQCRLYFDGVPIDVFFDTTGFHADLHLHVAHHELAGRRLPFLGCSDLAVFKAYFNRRKDWADIEEMLRADRLDVAYVTGVLAEYLGPDDERLRELHALRDEIEGRRG